MHNIIETVSLQNLSGHSAIVNCLAINKEGVLVSGADNGTLYFWDWRTGYNFQKLQAPVQPGEWHLLSKPIILYLIIVYVFCCM